MDTAIQRTSPLLINETPMQFLPALACGVGVNGALFAQQLHYCLQDSQDWFDGRPWVYYTFEEWNLQFPFWSKNTIRRIIKDLQSVTINGNTYRILLIGHSANKLDHRCCYTLDYDELDRLVPVATLLLQDKQRSIASKSISIKKNLSTLSRQFPALATSSE